MLFPWGLLIKLTKDKLGGEKRIHIFTDVYTFYFMQRGFTGKKKVKPKEVVRLRSFCTILRKGTKLWRSEQMKGRLGFWGQWIVGR